MITPVETLTELFQYVNSLRKGKQGSTDGER
jgi:hypothetical protein